MFNYIFFDITNSSMYQEKGKRDLNAQVLLTQCAIVSVKQLFELLPNNNTRKLNLKSYLCLGERELSCRTQVAATLVCQKYFKHIKCHLKKSKRLCLVALRIRAFFMIFYMMQKNTSINYKFLSDHIAKHNQQK